MFVDHVGDPPVPEGEVTGQPQLLLTTGHDAGGGPGVGAAAEIGLLWRIRDHAERSPKGSSGRRRQANGQGGRTAVDEAGVRGARPHLDTPHASTRGTRWFRPSGRGRHPTAASTPVPAGSTRPRSTLSTSSGPTAPGSPSAARSSACDAVTAVVVLGGLRSRRVLPALGEPQCAAARPRPRASSRLSAACAARPRRSDGGAPPSSGHPRAAQHTTGGGGGDDFECGAAERDPQVLVVGVHGHILTPSNCSFPGA